MVTQRLWLMPMIFAAFVLGAIIAPVNATPQFTTLYSFNAGQTADPGINGTGNFPRCTLVKDSSGNFYGTNRYGGASDYGTVFKITPAGVETTLASFTGVNGMGAYPFAGLTLGNDGNYYGTTNAGGAHSGGTVFKVTTTGVLTTIYSFTALDGNSHNTDGVGPWAGLTKGTDGNFYGTTNFGGTSNLGTIFKITPAGVLTVLDEFNGTNGGNPTQALTMGSDGNFYSVAQDGGTNGTGTFFRMTPTGALTVLYNFSDDSNGTNADGAYPLGGLVLGSDNNFYGTTANGGASGDGAVFKVTTVGAFTTLYSFDGTHGAFPYGSLLFDSSDGLFYGTTRRGGVDNRGTLFKISSTGTLTKLIDFNEANGALPVQALVQGGDGNFYGATTGGGLLGNGTVFKVTSAGVLTTLYTFINTGGVLPYGSLVAGMDGNFYGTCLGGANGTGLVYRVSPAGVATSIHNFSPTSTTFPFTNSDGAYSDTALYLNSDGAFYGTTQGGGMYGSGTVFKITPSGTLTTLHNFTAAPTGTNGDGNDPQSALVKGADGSFYGTTFAGGSTGNGTVFKITTAGVFTSLVSFTGANGAIPDASVILGSDGNFYGTTFNGGTSNDGTIFRMTPGGNLTTIYSFTAQDGNGHNPDGTNPNAALVKGTDGLLYGSTAFGGGTGDGTIFKISSSGILTTLLTFDGTDGKSPQTALVQGADGSFYGTTLLGGANGNGNVFAMQPSGVVTDLYDFSSNSPSAPFANADGAKPVGALLESPSGVFYGTALAGGTGGNGTIYKLSVSPAPTWNCKDVAAASDGTARLLWNRSDGAAGIWALNAADTQTAVGPTYGPVSDTHGTWSAKAIGTAQDATTRMLWDRSDGAAGVWIVSPTGTQTATGPVYGPYPGWSAQDIAAAPNGTSRVLWVNTNGMAGVWTFNAAGTETLIGTTYGPYSGWTAKAVGAAGDGTARILWSRSDGAAGLWTLNASDVQTAVGPTYGPYSDSHGTWSVGGLGTSSDGTSRVLWNRSDGSAGVWSFSASGVQTLVGTVYGPFAGYTAASLDASSDQSRVLWVNTARQAGIWTFGTNDAQSLVGTVYGPY